MAAREKRGAGTVLYALAVGPITQFFLPRFAGTDQGAADPR
ncbi:hypothetical protein [Nonomuraea sp. NPDC050643]